VEVLTGKEPDPRRDWLLPANGYLASARSRNKVRGWFHKLDRARNVQAGRELLDRELRRLGLMQADLLPMARKFHVDSVDDLHIAVALGDVGPSQIGRALLEQEKAPARLRRPARPTSPRVRRRAAPARMRARSRASPCRAWATCWCSWPAAATRWPASRSPATSPRDAA
jgi:GTP pyrophosphokinase